MLIGYYLGFQSGHTEGWNAAIKSVNTYGLPLVGQLRGQHTILPLHNLSMVGSQHLDA
jgi:hypothetical protein